jgi:hypothetical protein
MNKRELVGRCGLYCGACVIYRAERDEQKWRKQLAERWDCPEEKIRCNGCGALTPNCWGRECKFIKCLKEKGYKFCCECPNYESKTCEIFEKFSKRYLEENGVDLRKNLAMITAGKVDEWLTTSEKLFTCTFCGKHTAIGATKCHHCQRDIKILI